MTKQKPPRSKLRTPRYGRTLRRRYESVLARAKAVYECPKCGNRRVRRIRLGIWRCTKCNFEFTGGAWVPRTSAAAQARVAASHSRAEV